MHTYSWDADGNSITVDSVGATYDALDRIVELNRSGSLWCTILFMRPTFYRVTGMRNCALDRIAGHSVLGFPTHNPTHKKNVLYDFRVLWESPRAYHIFQYLSIAYESSLRFALLHIAPIRAAKSRSSQIDGR